MGQRMMCVERRRQGATRQQGMVEVEVEVRGVTILISLEDAGESGRPKLKLARVLLPALQGAWWWDVGQVRPTA